MSQIAENITLIKEKISTVALKAGRKVDEIKLVAVTKKVGHIAINEAIDAGIGIIGENRVQEALSKINLVKPGVEWHMIGHLQRNKAKSVITSFQAIHSLDSLDLAKEMNRLAKQSGRKFRALIQVNIVREETKTGVQVEDLFSLLEEIIPYEHLSLEGLMTIPPFSPEPEQSRPAFSQLRKLLGEIQHSFNLPSFKELSMGMSQDFEIAIEEGATFIRLGTAIFGPRPMEV